ncbi:MAG TPA: CehA/McbA family metallohydrolase [Chthonomonadales bacterium]|nr:CehA/McbA family metallohydrolase [Chthonomonadales bacterium]
MALVLRSPYLASGFVWLRGNLHAHSTRSDGTLEPADLCAAYLARGYDFLALADHDLREPLAAGEAPEGLLLIDAVEVSAGGPHLLAIGGSSAIEPCEDRQRVIDAIVADGGFAILNHPNWLHHYNHFPQCEMERLTGYAGIEIYNGVIDFLEGSALATDRWDRLLSTGRIVWGFANDDTHVAQNVGRAWNVVQATDRSEGAVFASLLAGRFYASTGVRIGRISTVGRHLAVSAPGADRIRFIGSYGRELAMVDGDEGNYTADGGEGGYVRVECLGAGGRAAWTQPFVVTQHPRDAPG